MKRLDTWFACALEACCAAEGVRPCMAFFAVVDDERMRELNRETRGVDSATDVLSYPAVSYPPGKTARDCPRRLGAAYDPEFGKPNLGDVFLSMDRVRQQAMEYGHSVTREAVFLAVHASLHLLGYDPMEEEERAKRRAMEDIVMDRLGIGRNPMDEHLFLRACEALENAYAPYSQYKVGACLLCEDGREFLGCNIENASYGATICAERAAVSAAVAQGARRFTAIAIAGEKGDSWPCGICRQVLNEFSVEMRVIVGQKGGAFDVVPLSELLPHSFGPGDLEQQGESQNG